MLAPLRSLGRTRRLVPSLPGTQPLICPRGLFVLPLRPSCDRISTGHYGNPGRPGRIAVVMGQLGEVYSTSSAAYPRSPTSGSGLPLMDDTIYALSTAPGRAALAVIRVSGPASRLVYESLCPNKHLPKPRRAAVRTLYHPLEKAPSSGSGSGSAGVVLDSSALVLWFPGPRTVTGEDVIEFQVHGGRATVKAVLSAIRLCGRQMEKGEAMGGTRIRYAEPGEFTKRAFLNDRLDLTQIDALGETLAAETEQQRRAAERGASAHLSARYESWREQLLLARGELEALIDFSEDQHFDESPSELMGNVKKMVDEMLRSVRMHEHGSRRSQLLRTGVKIALLGPPNVGKSSLMNLIVGKEASIVSDEAGTTRDVVEVSLDVRGYLCSFADTAGFRGEDGSSNKVSEEEADTVVIGAVEREGIRRARAAALSADVVVALGAVERSPSGSFGILYDIETIRLAASNSKPFIVAINKRDAVDAQQLAHLLASFRAEIVSKLPSLPNAPPPTILSCREAQAVAATSDPGGIHALTDQLVGLFESMTSMPADLEDLLGVTERQRQLLETCRAHLEDFVAEAEPPEGFDADIVVAAEHLRYAANALARITGRGDALDVEDVLGVVFEK